MTNNRKIRNIKQCRLCGKGGLKEVIDFGLMDLPTWPHSKGDGTKAPLKLMICPSCLLCQLAQSIDRESLFRQYWYRTGINETMRSHMAKLAASISKEIKLGNNDVVVDIGTNDGTLLLSYKKGRLIGFEPSNLCPKETKSKVTWINDFFDPKLLPKKDRGSVLALTTIAMFYYLDDPVAFAEEIKSVLVPDGIWVCEMTYALDIKERLSFDFINHEHVTLWSATEFSKVVQKAGLELFRIERNDLNGGSIRFWVGKPRRHLVEKSVSNIMTLEKGRLTFSEWLKFAKKVRATSANLNKIINRLHKNNKTIMVYGASTRGLTILGASLLDSKLISAAVERNPEKVGRFYGTTGIPVISEEEMRSARPQVLLILPYSFIKEFVKREKAYLEGGGIFVVPLPKPKIITKASLEVLI